MGVPGTDSGPAVARIRPYRPADLDALYRICLATGDDGSDATGRYRDPQLLGHVYAAPYGVLEPELAFVVEDSDGVGGYVLGAADSRAFEERLEREWWPALRARYPDPDPSGRSRWALDEWLNHRIHHPTRADDHVVATYPSHLHIDLLPRCQSGGNGARLISVLLDALARAGSPGVHLGVSRQNENATGFYRHLGFEEVASSARGRCLAKAL
ncbi:GNAT family N-acetyltransferase [soil metagenome]